MLYQKKIKCKECGYTFKGRKEAKQVNYRCNRRLSQGASSCPNSSRLDEDFITMLVRQKFNILDLDIPEEKYSEYIESIIAGQNDIVINYIPSLNTNPTIVNQRGVFYTSTDI